MNTQIVGSVALISSAEPLIWDVQSALDFMATVCYETGCDRIAVNKEALCADFFVLSTGCAGAILQKFVQYSTKIAIYGDYSRYTSGPLKDFIYESNRGTHVIFAQSADEAVERLTSAP